MVDCGSRIFLVRFWELPPWPAIRIAFGVGFHHRDGNEGRQTFQVEDKVRTVREWTEKTYIQMISPCLWRIRPIGRNHIMPGAIRVDKALLLRTHGALSMCVTRQLNKRMKVVEFDRNRPESTLWWCSNQTILSALPFHVSAASESNDGRQQG